MPVKEENGDLIGRWQRWRRKIVGVFRAEDSCDKAVSVSVIELSVKNIVRVKQKK